MAQGLLGDLLGHEERDLQRRTGLALERGGLGVWLVGEAGALLVMPGRRRVHCFCVRATDPELPPSDRVAHLLLALRVDEAASPPSPTTRSRGRRGACAAACRSGCAPPSTRPAARRGSPRPVAYDVVIAGGGFGGLYAARRLERRLPRHSARILLVTDVNFLLYTPLLPGAAAGSLEPRHVVVPLREELEWTDIRLGRVVGADPACNEVHVHTVDGREETLHYDQLIVTLGSVSRVLPVPGLAEHALGFKTLADAIALRNRALLNLEIAESLPDDEQPARVPDVRVRRRRLRRARGDRRAAGLRGRRDRPLPALPHRRHPLRAGRGAASA